MSKSGNNDRQPGELLLKFGYLSEGLSAYCHSESLSEEGLREIIERHGLTKDCKVSDYDFFLMACNNERVNEGAIRCLLEYFPEAANIKNGKDLTPFHYALGNQNMTPNIIQLLIDAAPDSVRSVTDRGSTPLHSLCNRRKVNEKTALQVLKMLIEKYPEAVRHADNDGDLPIHIACVERSPEFCQILIDSAPDSVRSVANDSLTPLHVLCNSRKDDEGTAMQILKLLIEKYPESVRHATNYGNLPLHLACVTKSSEFCQELIDASPDSVRSINNNGWMPLHRLCDDMEVNEATARPKLNLLIEKYPEAVRCPDNDGNLPIHLACTSKSPEFCQVLIDASLDSVHIVNKKGLMPLHYLCCNRTMEEAAALQVLKLLIEKNPEATRHVDGLGQVPIHNASLLRSPEFCRVLLDVCPGSERITTTKGFLPLQYACWKGTLPTVEYLYKLYPVNACTGGLHPIHAAIGGTISRDIPATAVEIVKFLLDCDPNQKYAKFEGRPLLHFACEREFDDSNIEAGIQVIKIIYDSHPEAIEDNRIASDIRRYHQQVQSFINGELVYARKAKDRRLMTTPDDNGQLPLHTALQTNVRLGSMKLLVEANPQAVQSPDNNGALPLHVACQHRDSVNVVQYLVEVDNTTLDAVDRDGNTALHYACRDARHEIIAMLLEKFDAVSVSKRNADKKHPIDLLWESNSVEDRVSVEYTDSVFRLLKVYPEMIMNHNAQDQAKTGACSFQNEKKRKLDAV